MIFSNDTSLVQKLDVKYAKKFFKMDAIPEPSNKWRVIFDKASGDNAYQVVVQDVASITNNHYHIFLYVKGECTGYVYHSCGPKLPPVWDKFGCMDYYDYVEIQKMMNKKFYEANGLVAPALDETREGKFVYFLAEPPQQAYEKALRGKSYQIVALKAEVENTVKEKAVLVNPFEENAKSLSKSLTGN